MQRIVLSSILEWIIYGRMETAGLAKDIYAKCAYRVGTQVNFVTPIKTCQMWSPILEQDVQCTMSNVHNMGNGGIRGVQVVPAMRGHCQARAPPA